tara:strand:- start:94 stop:579 length:486 start_codon:yes stop_codon:yes gene_type:complete
MHEKLQNWRTQMNKVKRESRETEVREDVAKKWQPASLLPEFKQQPGWAYRWVRVSLLNEADNMNVSSKMREGWEPVKHSEHPEVVLQSDPNSQFKEGIEIGGLLLCKAPQEMMDQRQAFVNEKTRAQTEAVDQSYLNQNDPRMPKFAEGQENGKSFGRGKK